MNLTALYEQRDTSTGTGFISLLFFILAGALQILFIFAVLLFVGVTPTVLMKQGRYSDLQRPAPKNALNLQSSGQLAPLSLQLANLFNMMP